MSDDFTRRASLLEQIKRDEAAFAALSPGMQRAGLNELEAIWPGISRLLAQGIEAAAAGETREAGLDAKRERAVAEGQAPDTLFPRVTEESSRERRLASR